MKKYCTLTLCTLAVLGVGVGQATAGHLLRHFCCKDHKYTVICKPYNAFSPPCCQPCGHHCHPWPCNMMPYCPYPYPPGGDCCAFGGCDAGQIVPAPGGESRPMPPATAAPGYMPPAPTEVDTQGMMPMWGQPMAGPWMQPVAYPPMMNYPPMQPMIGYGMPQGMMPMYGPQ
jgi:hypothetical protein